MRKSDKVSTEFSLTVVTHANNIIANKICAAPEMKKNAALVLTGLSNNVPFVYFCFFFSKKLSFIVVKC